MSDVKLSPFMKTEPTQDLESFKGVKKVPFEEYYTSGHRKSCGWWPKPPVPGLSS